MAVVMGPSGLMSVGTPFQQRRRRRGAGQAPSAPAPAPSISVSGTTVTVNGQSFSVAPSEQEAFIRSKGGAVTSKIEQQIALATQVEAKRQTTLREQREAEAFERTVAGQVTSISELPSVEQRAIFATEGIEPPAPRFTGELLKQAGREFFFIEGTPITAVGTIFSPIRFRKPEKKGVIIDEEFFRVGRLQAGLLELGFGGQEVITEKEFLKQKLIVDPSLLIPVEAKAFGIQEEISKVVVSELQPRITAGEIGIPKAEEILKEEVGRRFEERIPELEEAAKFKTEFGKFETGKFFEARKPAEIGATIAAFATPFGVALVGGAAIAEGLPKIVGGETLVERGLGIAQVGIGLTIGAGAIRFAERQADILLLEELQQKVKFDVGQEFIKGEKFSVFKFRGGATFGPEATVKTELIAPVFRTGRETFVITGGRGVQKLEFFSVARGKLVTSIDTFRFGGEQFISKLPPVVSGPLGTKVTQLDFKGVFGEGFVQRVGADPFRISKFGAVSKDTGLVTQFRAGRLEKIILKDLTKLRRGGLLFGKTTGRFRVEDIGVVKRLKGAPGGVTILGPRGIEVTSFPETAVKFIQPADIIKTPLSKTFGEQVLKEISIAPPISLAGAAGRQVFTQVTKDVAQQGLGFGLPFAVGGLGLTQEQLEKETAIVTPSFDLGARFETRVSAALGTGLLERQDVLSRQRLTAGQLQIPREAQVFAQVPVTAQAQVSRLRTRQVQKQFNIPQQVLSPRFRKGFDFGFGFEAPSFGLRFPKPPTREKERVTKARRRKAPRIPIRPSLTGIILEIPEAAEPVVIAGIDIGITPAQIRGLETGFIVPKRKKKKKKKKKK